MINRILVPLDGSSRAESGLPFALAVQRAFGSEIVLLRVVDVGRGRPGVLSEGAGWRIAEAEARCYLKQVGERLEAEGIEAEVAVVSGVPSAEIIEAAEGWDADLVILTSHGAGRAAPFPHGGTTGKILASANTSFLLVRPPARGNLSGFTLKRILVPVDGSPRSEWAMNLGAAIARSSGVELGLLLVVQRPELLQVSAAGTEATDLAEGLVQANRAAGQRYLAERRRHLTAAELPVGEKLTIARSVPRAIQEAASREEGCLLVLSAHSRSAGAGWAYGSVASALLSEGTGPILVFQDLPRRMPQRSRRSGRYARSAPGAGDVWNG